jgi:hypothetical protein
MSNHIDMFHRDIRTTTWRTKSRFVLSPSYDQLSAPLRSSIDFSLVCRNREPRIAPDVDSLIDLAHQGIVRPTATKGPGERDQRNVHRGLGLGALVAG